MKDEDLITVKLSRLTGSPDYYYINIWHKEWHNNYENEWIHQWVIGIDNYGKATLKRYLKDPWHAIQRALNELRKENIISEDRYDYFKESLRVKIVITGDLTYQEYVLNKKVYA